MRKQRPKRPCARAWLYSFEEIVVLASSAKMAPPANVALLRVKLAEVTSDMSTCVCVGGRTCRKGHNYVGRVYVEEGVCGRVYVGGCMWEGVCGRVYVEEGVCGGGCIVIHTPPTYPAPINKTPHTQST